jgi:dienelactone hydrolase
VSSIVRFAATVIGVGLLAGYAGAAQDGNVTADELRVAIYDVAGGQPLNARVAAAPALKDEAPKLKALRKRSLVTFDSVNEQRVPCILTTPLKARSPFPAVLLLAGSGGHKDTDYVRLTSDMLNTIGFAALSLDAQYHGDRSRQGRSGDVHMVHDVTCRDAWIQTVRDLRRAVDYLRSRRDIDRDRIGFVGFSQGAMIGATFIGVEPRIRAACLAVPGAGFVEWAQRANLTRPEQQRELQVGAALTDPLHFIGRFAPRPLLILAARRDELIPSYATEALVAAAKEPKQVRWYSSGHVLPPNALLVDAKGFLVRHLAARSVR